ncbi:sulfur carrier protein ThiS adenylyltransferase ThiF [Campylobacter sp. RM16190]|uniref:sulfur carrier protein ThiS adenylyltransferase ThiF n=1 Tax=Campylobacter sp. RM16190 TaxID=1705727 RepID=UPI0014734193|nr:sulfur carrier protein ThiS adenylyltransferase ThiF [Campylobacter sp. RM16190]
MTNVTINGANFKIQSKTMDELKSEIFSNKELYQFLKKFSAENPDIFILNGFATSENLDIKDGANIVLIKRGVMPEAGILRSMIEARNTPELNDALKHSCIGVAGLGGLGSNIAISLARVGVAKLVLVDFDVVEPSNLNRQYYFIKHIGMKKAEALKSMISEINPFVNVITHDIFLDSSNVAEIFAPCSIICEAFDNVASKTMIVNEAGASLKDKQIIAASGMAGYHSSNLIKTIKFAKNVHICGDLNNAAKAGQGLMAPRVAICANHQANLAIRLMMNLEA